ncbi:MAG TPA: hypothetical protein VFQ58_01725, partial [Flavisolibacter sp.]|nr:hypothetical protein [Flavisolibacter sp.]
MITVKSKPFLSLSGRLLALTATLLFSFYLFKKYNIRLLEFVVLTFFCLFWVIIEYWGHIYFPKTYSKLSWRISNHLIAYIYFVLLLILFYTIVPEAGHYKNQELFFLAGFPALAIGVDYFLGKIVNEQKELKENIKY